MAKKITPGRRLPAPPGSMEVRLLEYLQGQYPILTIRPGAMKDFTILCPEMAALAHAGQFVHIRVPGFSLRRPISIAQVDKAAGTLRFLFDIRGEGTRVLADCKEGDMLDLMGPLGNGFTLLDPSCHAIVVGGGIGVPPMLQTALHYGPNATAVLGFRSADKIVLTQDFADAGCPVELCTDDGSAGFHGVVTEPLRRCIEQKKPDIVYACGPKIMLKFVAQLCAQYGVRCQVSLEERMACGVGACLGCATPIRQDDGSVTFLHVCKNGPVFDAERVVFDD